MILKKILVMCYGTTNHLRSLSYIGVVFSLVFGLTIYFLMQEEFSLVFYHEFNESTVLVTTQSE